MADMHIPRGGYETSDVSVKLFARMIVGLVLITLAGMGVSLWFFGAETRWTGAKDTLPPPLASTLPQQPPEPRLQVAPWVDLQRYKSEEEAILSSYAWIDAKGGIVRIPIDRAMDLIADRGLPVRSETGVAASAPAKKSEAKGKP